MRDAAEEVATMKFRDLRNEQNTQQDPANHYGDPNPSEDDAGHRHAASTLSGVSNLTAGHIAKDQRENGSNPVNPNDPQHQRRDGEAIRS